MLPQSFYPVVGVNAELILECCVKMPESGKPYNRDDESLFAFVEFFHTRERTAERGVVHKGCDCTPTEERSTKDTLFLCLPVRFGVPSVDYCMRCISCFMSCI